MRLDIMKKGKEAKELGVEILMPSKPPKVKR